MKEKCPMKWQQCSMSSALSWLCLPRPALDERDLVWSGSAGPYNVRRVAWAGQHRRRLPSHTDQWEARESPSWPMRSQTDRRAAGQNIRPEGRGRDVTGGAGWGRRRQNTSVPVHMSNMSHRDCHAVMTWPLTPQTRVLRAPWSQALIQDDVRLRSRFEICDIETLRREPGSWPSPTRGTWRAPPPGASPESSSSGREAHCHLPL